MKGAMSCLPTCKKAINLQKTLDVLAFAKFLQQQFQEEKISELLEANGISLHSQKNINAINQHRRFRFVKKG